MLLHNLYKLEAPETNKHDGRECPIASERELSFGILGQVKIAAIVVF
jgi:hypothetical protein